MTAPRTMAANAIKIEIEERRRKRNSAPPSGSDLTIINRVGPVGDNRYKSDRELLRQALNDARVTLYAYLKREGLLDDIELKKELWAMIKYEVIDITEE
jgi:hypothetical protein